MNQNDFEVGMLTSMALFRQLSNDRESVFSIVSYFIIDVLRNHRLSQITLPETAELVNVTFNFDLPESIIRAGMKHLIKQDYVILRDKIYFISEKIRGEVKHDLRIEINKIESDNSLIFKTLVAYVESLKNEILNQNEQSKLFKSLCNFLLDENKKDGYSDFVSGFILVCKKEPTLLDKLRSIKEGIILHSGIRYGIESNVISKWHKNLVIFLDQEVLFSYSGFNGIVYKGLTDDFIRLVNEVNANATRKKGKKLVELRYFRTTKKSVDNFFDTASNILSKNSISDPHVAAMNHILTGCETISDVLDKKIQFYRFLEKNEIMEEDQIDYYSDEQRKYNIACTELNERAIRELNIYQPYDHIELLNLVNIRRKSRNEGRIESIGYILLTETGSTLKLSWSDLLKNEVQCPLAVNTNYMVIYLWLILNKGFGKNDLPSSFNLVTRAQAILATRISGRISEKFEMLKLDYSAGKLSKDEVYDRLVEYRSMVKLPEEISSDNIREILQDFSNTELENKANEFKKTQLELIKIQEEKRVLREEYELLMSESEVEKMNNSSAIEDLRQEIVEGNIRFNELYRQLEQIKIDKERKKASIKKWMKGIFYSASSLIILTLLMYYKEFISEPISYIASLITVFLLLYALYQNHVKKPSDH
jgi:hypothetical protein